MGRAVESLCATGGGAAAAASKQKAIYVYAEEDIPVQFFRLFHLTFFHLPALMHHSGKFSPRIEGDSFPISQTLQIPRSVELVSSASANFFWASDGTPTDQEMGRTLLLT